MKPLISVIIPVYNVEKYIKRCLDSVINQTYENLEIILVDDGTPDNSGVICDEYAKKDERIKVIHKENGGLSSARNAGLDIAKGEYISFIDSDDYISDNFIERLYENLSENGAEIAQCGFKRTAKDSEEKDSVSESVKIYSGVEMLGHIHDEKGAETVVVWNKLYKAELFCDVRFPVGKIHEDEATTYKIFYKVKKVAMFDDKNYFYFFNENSITNKAFSLKKLDYIDALEERMAFCKEHNLNCLYKKDALSCVREILKFRSCAQEKNIKKMLSAMCIKKMRIVLKQDFGLKTKIRYILYFIFPKSQEIMYNYYKKKINE